VCNSYVHAPRRRRAIILSAAKMVVSTSVLYIIERTDYHDVDTSPKSTRLSYFRATTRFARINGNRVGSIARFDEKLIRLLCFRSNDPYRQHPILLENGGCCIAAGDKLPVGIIHGLSGCLYSARFHSIFRWQTKSPPCRVPIADDRPRSILSDRLSN